MAAVTIGQAKGTLSCVYETLAELAATEVTAAPPPGEFKRKPEYWVGRMQHDLFSLAEMFQVLLAQAEKNAPEG